MDCTQCGRHRRCRNRCTIEHLVRLRAARRHEPDPDRCAHEHPGSDDDPRESWRRHGMHYRRRRDRRAFCNRARSTPARSLVRRNGRRGPGWCGNRDRRRRARCPARCSRQASASVQTNYGPARPAKLMRVLGDDERAFFAMNAPAYVQNARRFREGSGAAPGWKSRQAGAACRRLNKQEQ